MPAPKDVLAQLLSPAQAEVLAGVGASVWQAASAALEALIGALPGMEAADGRLVMPEEIISEFGEPHLVLALELSTDLDQTATAYAVAATAQAAAFFECTAADPEDQEQQTVVVVSTVLGQVVSQLNNRVFSKSTGGLVLSLDEVTANTMPALLGAMDEPALALTATLQTERPLPFTFVLPGTFLDIVAGAMPAAGAGGPSAAAAPAPEAPGAGLPFSLTLDELDAAELIDEPELAPLTRGRGSMHDPAGAFAAPAARQPTPISQAPAAAAHRARFAPLPETQPGLSRSAIDMISGLQMNVCVELGRTELTVADVLGLGAGSVIELNRLAGEPVDILVNDRLIARGEVVVVDENFGVRVVEVVRRPAPDLEERAG